jgi:hypothetical protein
MDDLNNDDIRKAMNEYDGISRSQNERSGKVDLCNIAGLSFLNHLAHDTQITRATIDFCHSIEHYIYTELIGEGAHFEFFEGQMTKTEIFKNEPIIFLDRREFFNAIKLGIDMYVENQERTDIDINDI